MCHTGTKSSLADQHQSHLPSVQSVGYGQLPFLAFPLLPSPLPSQPPVLTAHWHLPQPCLLRAQPGSGLGCEVGECTGPAAPFLASSRLLIPCEAHISFWCDPCTCSEICLCSSWDPVPLSLPSSPLHFRGRGQRYLFLFLPTRSLLGLIPPAGK